MAVLFPLYQWFTIQLAYWCNFHLTKTDKDDQELINLKSGKFSIDYHYRTEIIKEMESLEALKKVMFMMTVIADEMISNNLN